MTIQGWFRSSSRLALIGVVLAWVVCPTDSSRASGGELFPAQDQLPGFRLQKKEQRKLSPKDKAPPLEEWEAFHKPLAGDDPVLGLTLIISVYKDPEKALAAFRRGRAGAGRNNTSTKDLSLGQAMAYTFYYNASKGRHTVNVIFVTGKYKGIASVFCSSKPVKWDLARKYATVLKETLAKAPGGIVAPPPEETVDTEKMDLPPPRASQEPQDLLPGWERLGDWFLKSAEKAIVYPGSRPNPEAGTKGTYRAAGEVKTQSGMRITIWKFADNAQARTAWNKLMVSHKVKPVNREALDFGPWPGTGWTESRHGVHFRHAMVRLDPFVVSLTMYTKKAQAPTKAQVNRVIVALWRKMAGLPPEKRAKPSGPPPLMSLAPDRRYLPGWRRSSADLRDRQGTVGVPAEKCLEAIYNPTDENKGLARFMSMSICRYPSPVKAMELLDKLKVTQKRKIKSIEDKTIGGCKGYYYENYHHQVGFTATARAAYQSYVVDVTLFSKSFQPSKDEAAKIVAKVILKLSGKPPPDTPGPDPPPQEKPGPKPDPGEPPSEPPVVKPGPEQKHKFALTALLPRGGEIRDWAPRTEEQGYAVKAHGGVLPWNQVVQTYGPEQGSEKSTKTLHVHLMDFNSRAQAARHWTARMAELTAREKGLRRLRLKETSAWLSLSRDGSLARVFFLQGWYIGEMGLRIRGTRIKESTVRPILESVLTRLKAGCPKMGPEPRFAMEVEAASLALEKGAMVPLKVMVKNTTDQPLKDIWVRVWTGQDSSIRLSKEKNQIGHRSLDFKFDQLQARYGRSLPILVEGSGSPGQALIKLASVPGTGVRTVVVDLKPPAGAQADPAGLENDPAHKAFGGLVRTLEEIDSKGGKAALSGQLEDLPDKIVLIAPLDSKWDQDISEWKKLLKRENRALGDLLGQVETEAHDKASSLAGKAFEVVNFFNKMYKGVAYLISPERTEEEIIRAVGGAFLPPGGAELTYLAEYRQWRLKRLKLESGMARLWPPLVPATVGFTDRKEVIRGLYGRMPDGRTYLLPLGTGTVSQLL